MFVLMDSRSRGAVTAAGVKVMKATSDVGITHTRRSVRTHWQCVRSQRSTRTIKENDWPWPEHQQPASVTRPQPHASFMTFKKSRKSLPRTSTECSEKVQR